MILAGIGQSGIGRLNVSSTNYMELRNVSIAH